MFPNIYQILPKSLSLAYIDRSKVLSCAFLQAAGKQKLSLKIVGKLYGRLVDGGGVFQVVGKS